MRRIPNKGKGFFIEGGKNIMERAKARQKRMRDKSKVLKVTKIPRSTAPAFKNPYFVSVK